jgi:sulfonate dioxygenase
MAPSIAETPIQPDSVPTSKPYKPRFTPGETIVNDAPIDEYEHVDLLPSFPDISWPPLSEVPYEDKGLLGTPDYRHLFADATDVFDYTPKIGTEIHGVSLKSLTDAQKNDLARLIAHRGVVFFRDQDDFEIEDQLELGRYWGTLHKHATTAVPRKKGLEEVHVVYMDGNSLDQRALFTPAHLWHADVCSHPPHLVSDMY